jgi:hypothetical protein
VLVAKANGKNGHHPPDRVLHLTPATAITIRPVRWLWDTRIALGTLCLVGGREAVGKSLLTYTLASQLTRGTLPGVYLGLPKAVIVAAAEDSWEHTIVPRLMAAGADLSLIYRLGVTTTTGTEGMLQLPIDLVELQRVILESGAALVMLDPLLSRIASDLDTHKDADVRTALEPIVTVADRSGAAVIGLIHVNKSASTDPLTLLMGSRAFAAVARSVLFVMTDPDDPLKRLIGQAKNNLGRSDLPTLSFQIASERVAESPDGDIWTAKVEWLGDSLRSINDAIIASAGSPHEQSAVAEALEWLTDYLEAAGGPVESVKVKRAGNQAGHSVMSLQRARVKLNAVVSSVGFPKRSFWQLAVVSTPFETTDVSDYDDSFS